MKISGLRVALIGSALAAAALAGVAQQDQKPLYLDPAQPAEKRAVDLVSHLTLEEKYTQLVNQSRAVQRMNIPSYDWWSESLHGVMASGVTSFPEPVGLGATFDTATIHEMAVVIGTEARIKHAQVLKLSGGSSKIFQGLDFWAPNINIFRDPRWGRGQETYGEDPFLTARLGVSFVEGMQGDDPRYYRVIATPKHFAVHSGPESTRHTANVPISKHDEVDTYLPAFRAAITEGKAGSVMCAYNSINGEPACANQFLLQDELRGKWKFQGYVVSDCGAVIDIYHGHHYKDSQPAASAVSLQRGMDNECVDYTTVVKDDHDYKPYADAVSQGLLKESEIDVALVRLFTARIKLGVFDPPEMVPYNKIDESQLNSAEHRALARKLANESMVLLKNDGVLPLTKSGLQIAVVGPLAEQTNVLLGNYNGTPTHTVSILEGIKGEFPQATVRYVEGTQFLSKRADETIPTELFSVDGKPGLRVTYTPLNTGMTEDEKKSDVKIVRIEPTINVADSALPAEVQAIKPLRVRWEAMLTPKETADYSIGVQGRGFFRMTIDGKRVETGYDTNAVETKLTTAHLEAGKPVKVEAEYGITQDHESVMRLVWKKVDMKPQPEAVAVARDADVVIAVVGITSELEGEEMNVQLDGFKGGDRTSLDLPKPEQDLLEALYATHKPLVVVLTNGSALGVNWANDHANAILEAWYPGEEGGSAVAETLSGRNNPAGRLPVTFYKDISQLPAFEDYSMKGRTYRYFQGAPLYPFGYGLSYTHFTYSNLNAPAMIDAGGTLPVDATVTNSGKLAGDEVVQLYLNFPTLPGAPLRALRGFQRVHLQVGESKTVHFELSPRDMSMVTEDGTPVVAEGQYTLSVGGGQPSDVVKTLTQPLHIKGQQILPE